jgi:acyl-CoA synthetase (AMP-forming)/AMP-acid ligase II
MLAELLNPKTCPHDQMALGIADGHMTWGQLRNSAAYLAECHQKLARRRVGLHFFPVNFSYALLFALETLNVDLFLLDSRLEHGQAAEIARDLRLGALVTPPHDNADTSGTIQEFENEAPWSGAPSITILTSGTTGKPKAARHTWQSLGRPTRRIERSEAPRWLQTYRPHLYAGLQVLLQCFVNYGTLYVPLEGWSPSQIARFAAMNDVQFFSATPSYWRWLLLFSDSATLNALNPAQITLGGEVVDQSILDSLRNRFPNARIVHIYATTELGRCFSVTDGMEGFPRRFLDGRSSDVLEMRSRDGELLIRSNNAMVGYDPFSDQISPENGWIATGDLVTVKGDRVVFTGRKTEIINVGGNKVHPLEVEKIIRSTPGVGDARVFAKKSPISGQLVACEIVSDKSRSDDELREAIRRICHATLSTYQRPRLIRIVDQIELSSAQKIRRGENH